MSKDPKFTQCIACEENLHYKPLEDWSGGFNLDLPYCPNERCLRYGLLTLDSAELLTDKVKGFAEKAAPTTESEEV
jgi:hypothetical protein